jgi:hypothetical protein
MGRRPGSAAVTPPEANMPSTPKLVLLIVLLVGVVGTALAAWAVPSFRDALTTVAVLLLLAVGLIQAVVG